MSNRLQTKIGFYFGTFNPIHWGHLAIARQAQSQFKLDRLVFIPAGHPPFKDEDPELANAEIRLAMVKLAIMNEPTWAVDQMEINREGISYTIDTLKALRKNYDLGKSKIPFIIGSDALSDLHLWHRPIEIINEVTFLQAPRQGFPPVKILELNQMLIPLDTRIINMPEDQRSSTAIREAFFQGKDIKDFVPEGVATYLKEHLVWQAPGLSGR